MGVETDYYVPGFSDSVKVEHRVEYRLIYKIFKKTNYLLHTVPDTDRVPSRVTYKYLT